MAAAHARASKEEASHSGRLLLRMPPDLHSELARAAEAEGTSLNAYITQRLSDGLSGEAPAPSGPSRFLRIAVLADLVLVAIATVAVVALVVVAWP